MATFISIRHGFSLGLVLAFVSSIVLVIHALTNDVNVKSGVVTIQVSEYHALVVLILILSAV